MSKCFKTDKIQDYLERNLPDNELEAFATHIKTCPSCLHEVMTLKNLASAAHGFARRQLSIEPPVAAVDKVMHKIRAQNNATVVKKTDTGTDPSENTGILQKLRWLLVPALALILVCAYRFDRNEPGSIPVDAEAQQFSLHPGRAEVILSGTPALSLPEILPETRIILPEGSVILVQSGRHKFKFSARADFVYGRQVIIMNDGLANCDLSGSHQGLKIVTPAVTVTPLGTSFELEIKNWGTRVSLREGSLEMLNNKGIKRILTGTETIYVATDGSYSAEIPQPITIPGNSEPPIQHRQPGNVPETGVSGSPGSLIDSF